MKKMYTNNPIIETEIIEFDKKELDAEKRIKVLEEKVRMLSEQLHKMASTLNLIQMLFIYLTNLALKDQEKIITLLDKNNINKSILCVMSLYWLRRTNSQLFFIFLCLIIILCNHILHLLLFL